MCLLRAAGGRLVDCGRLFACTLHVVTQFKIPACVILATSLVDQHGAICSRSARLRASMNCARGGVMSTMCLHFIMAIAGCAAASGGGAPVLIHVCASEARDGLLPGAALAH